MRLLRIPEYMFRSCCYVLRPLLRITMLQNGSTHLRGHLSMHRALLGASRANNACSGHITKTHAIQQLQQHVHPMILDIVTSQQADM